MAGVKALIRSGCCAAFVGQVLGLIISYLCQDAGNGMWELSIVDYRLDFDPGRSCRNALIFRLK